MGYYWNVDKYEYLNEFSEVKEREYEKRSKNLYRIGGIGYVETFEEVLEKVRSKPYLDLLGPIEFPTRFCEVYVKAHHICIYVGKPRFHKLKVISLSEQYTYWQGINVLQMILTKALEIAKKANDAWLNSNGNEHDFVQNFYFEDN